MIKTIPQHNVRCEIRTILWEIITKTDELIEYCDKVSFGFNNWVLYDVEPKMFLDNVVDVMNLYIENFLFGIEAEIAKESYKGLWTDRIQEIQNEESEKPIVDGATL